MTDKTQSTATASFQSQSQSLHQQHVNIFSTILHRLRDGSKDILAGTAAGMMAKFVEYPFDTLKTRLQTSNVYKGPMDCAKQMLQKDGVAGLYRGIAAPLYGAMAENAIMFLAYGEAKRTLGGVNEHGQIMPLPYHKTALAGFLSGFTVAFWLTPVELIKCRLQAAHTSSQYTGTMDCIRQTWKTDRLRGFFKGHTGTLLREAPGNACYFTAYEMFCNLLTPEGKSRSDLSPLRTMAAGSCGGVAYWLSFFPADVVKSRMQTDLTGSHSSFSKTLRSIYRNEGIRGLYSGLSVTLVRAVPANAVIFFCYESVLKALG